MCICSSAFQKSSQHGSRVWHCHHTGHVIHHDAAYFYLLKTLHWSWVRVIPLMLIFLTIEAIFFAGNVQKIAHGAGVTLTLMTVFLRLCMCTTKVKACLPTSANLWIFTTIPILLMPLVRMKIFRNSLPISYISLPHVLTTGWKNKF
ncbi:MAG: KUP/HAK/KT family potassium transporter [Saprospiraceae bacterium]|nr:KUP/HAK/KT family potassium transporter [Saprospiraceae bacterium]